MTRGLYNQCVALCATIAAAMTLGTFARAQSQGDAGAPPPMSPADYQNLTEVKLDCPKVQDKPIAGVVSCDDSNNKPGFRSQIINNVLTRLDNEIKLRYEGKAVYDWKTGETYDVPVPVCNANENEIDKNHLGQSCGQPCHIRIEGYGGVAPNDVHFDANAPYCDRERAWYYGMEVASQRYFILQTLLELKRDGRIKISKMKGPNDEHVACHPMAADLIDLQKDVNSTLDLVVNKVGTDQASQLICSGDKKNLDDHINLHTSCRMEMAQKRLAMFWARLIRCEGLVRSKNDLVARAVHANDEQQHISDNLKDVCTGDKYDAGCTFCTNSTRTERFNRCYTNESPGVIREQVKPFNYRDLERQLGPRMPSSIPEGAN